MFPMIRKELVNENRAVWIKDYCNTKNEVRPFYWIEESAELYAKANNLVKGIRKSEKALEDSRVNALADIDADLIELWQSFEKEAIDGIQYAIQGKISSISLPSIFSFPKPIYYYHGILLFRIQKDDVIHLLALVLES